MSFLQPDEQDLQNLHKLLIEGLGSQYQVEQNTVVEGCLPFIKETFDCVILKDGEPLAAIEYKSIAYSIDLYIREEWLYDKFKKIGIQFGILYFGRHDEFYLYKKGAYHFTKFFCFFIHIAVKANYSVRTVFAHPFNLLCSASQ